MNPKVKKQWIDALLSGEYKKGTLLHVIRNDEHSFDVLGVLCDLYAKRNGKEWEIYSFDHSNNTGYFKICEEIIRLPEEVMKWAEIPRERCPYIILSDKKTLSQYGDAKTFEAVAEIIEREL